MYTYIHTHTYIHNCSITALLPEKKRSNTMKQPEASHKRFHDFRYKRQKERARERECESERERASEREREREREKRERERARARARERAIERGRAT
jgi:hypothetical protein